MRLAVSEFEKFYGMLFWETDFEPLKGSIKENYSDFIVEEILPDGTVLTVENPDFPHSGYEGLFTHFVLVKEGIGNYEVVWLLSEKLKVPTSWFSYYGNKDRDALTTQKMAVWGVPPEKLLQISLPNNIRILNPKRELRRLNIGQHKGNRFKITIRNLESSGEFKELEEFLKTASSNRGIFLPNFFGYQRFGVTKPVSAIVGKQLLKKRYKDAIITFLTFPSVYDDETLNEVKKNILEGNYREALSLIPKKGFIFEKNALMNLLRYGENYKKIIKKLPRILIRMLLEAYQSYIFNLALSKYKIDYGDFPQSSGNYKIPLLGYDTKLKENKIGIVIKEILKEENVKLDDFRNKEIPSLNLGGSQRESVLEFKLSEYEIRTSMNEAYLVFSLKKGQFATIVMREIFKENILNALYSKLARRFGEKNFHERMKSIIRRGLEMLKTI